MRLTIHLDTFDAINPMAFAILWFDKDTRNGAATQADRRLRGSGMCSVLIRKLRCRNTACLPPMRTRSRRRS
jgi:hypothetical protein